MPGEKELTAEEEDLETSEDEEEGEGSDKDSEADKGDKKPEDKKEEPADDKEKNRKGFEQRQQLKTQKESKINELSKKLDEVTSKLDLLSGEKTDSDFRRNNPNVSDDLFNLIKSTSKGSGKSYEETLKDPIIKGHLETQVSKDRVDSVTLAPSTKTSAGGKNDIWNMSDDEFKAKQLEVLRKNA